MSQTPNPQAKDNAESKEVKIMVKYGELMVYPTFSVLRNALKDAIDKLPQSEESENFCLYIFTVMKNKALMESDLRYMKIIDSQVREFREQAAHIKSWIQKLAIYGSLAVMGYFASLLPMLVN